MSLILDLGHNKPVLKKIVTNLPLFLIEDGLEPLFLRQVQRNNSICYEICQIDGMQQSNCSASKAVLDCSTSSNTFNKLFKLDNDHSLVSKENGYILFDHSKSRKHFSDAPGVVTAVHRMGNSVMMAHS